MKGRLLGGRYQLDKTIGEGGMGIVYRARDVQTGDVVAVKVIRDTISSEARAVKRFLREADAARGLHHPGIVRMLDEGTDVEHYLVMEYVDGITIREWVRTYGRNWRPVVTLLGDVLGALFHAHKRGIIHRDIKPENVIVTRAEHHAKLMDFGLARPLVGHGNTITQSGAIVGTVAYMSPEQAAGKRGDERSDLYSLGVVAYELLTGKRPFSGESPMQTLLKHIQDDPPPPRRHNPGLPQALEDVIMRLLAKKPDDRYADAARAWEAFNAVLEAPPAREPRPRPAAAPEPRSVPAARPRTPHGMRSAAVAGQPGVPLRKERPQPHPEPRAVEMAVLYTEVQSSSGMLDDHHPLDAAHRFGLFRKAVEEIARLTKGRILDHDGFRNILVFDGTQVENPAAQALKAVQRMKVELADWAGSSQSGESSRSGGWQGAGGFPQPKGGESSRSGGWQGAGGFPQPKGGETPVREVFLSAGIYTARLRLPQEGSVDDSIREEMLNGARLLHGMSAHDRRWCVICDATHRRLHGAVATTPVKSICLAGRKRPVQVYEMKDAVG